MRPCEGDVDSRAAATGPYGPPVPGRGDGVAYLLQVFPKHSETFILNELLEHQRRGAPLRVLSLRLPRDGRFHECLGRLEQSAEYVAESFWDKPGKIGEAFRDAARRRARGVVAAGRHWFGRSVTLRDFWQALLVRRWAQRRGVRHFHCHFGGYAARVAYLSRLMGGPGYSVTLHAFDIFRDDVDAELLRRIVAGSEFCVTVSNFNASFLRERIGAAPAKTRVLYNGIPLTRFAYYEGPREPDTVVGVGRLIEKKGFVHLVRACAALTARGRPVRCRIIGDGPLKDELKAEIARLGVAERVELVGAWSQERVAEALRRAAVFALPCVEARDGNMDALPTVLLEAMAAGCPCVSTRLSGIPEIVEDGCSGLLVSPGDEAALAGAIERLMSSPAEARALAMAARARVERLFDVRRNVGVLADWLDAAAGGRTRPAPAASAGEVRAATPAVAEGVAA